MLWKKKHLDGPPNFSLFTLQKHLRLIPEIMPWRIVVFRLPIVYVIISKKIRKIELDYLPTHHFYLLFIPLWHSQTWKYWHHNNIITRLPKKIKLCLIPFTNKTLRKPYFFGYEVLFDTASMNPHNPIVSFLSIHFPKPTPSSSTIVL